MKQEKQKAGSPEEGILYGLINSGRTCCRWKLAKTILADIRIERDRITAIGTMDPLSARKVVDARGLFGDTGAD